MSRTNLALLQKVVGWLFIAAFLYFFASTLASEWPKLSQHAWQPDWGYLLLFVLILFARPPLSAFGWRWLVLRLGGPPLNFRQTIHVYFAASLGRYLPGSVWYAVGRVVLGERVGISRGLGSLSLVLETALITFTGLLVAPFALAATPLLAGANPLLVTAAYAAFVALAVALMWRNDLFFSLLNWGLRRLKRQPVEGRLGFSDLLLLNLPFLLGWLLYAVLSYCLVAFVYPVSLSLALPLGASFIAAWAVGFLTFVAPNGFGVREGVAVYLLSFYLPAWVPLIVAVLSRLGSLVADVPWAILAGWYGRGLAQGSKQGKVSGSL